MNIFVINSGSSSLKYQLIEMPSEILACSGIVERIGKEDASVTHKIFKGNEEQVKRLALPIADHEQGLKEVVSLLTDQVIGVINDPSEIQVVGHRVVHGGESFAATTIITSEVK
ncbi:MAG: acetate kinase, partial [Ginsengibacter sp.]